MGSADFVYISISMLGFCHCVNILEFPHHIFFMDEAYFTREAVFNVETATFGITKILIPQSHLDLCNGTVSVYGLVS